jgi:hypothetical protein
MVSLSNGGLGVGRRVLAPADLRVGSIANDFNACAGVVACFALVAGFFAVAFFATGFLVVVFFALIFFLSLKMFY